MRELKVSEAKRKSNKKWDDENTAQIGIKAKKEIVQQCKEYAEKQNITVSKFAIKAMLYCIEKEINL